MTTKKFIIKTTVMIFIFAVLSTIVMTFLSSGVLTNDIALGQMRNDDLSYLIWQEYQALAPIIYTVYGVITLGFIGKIAYDTYKFIKTKKKEKEENEED
jgi:ABC-type dipeptide/oligopeptide/nickel transport system permease subunit